MRRKLKSVLQQMDGKLAGRNGKIAVATIAAVMILVALLLSISSFGPIEIGPIQTGWEDKTVWDWLQLLIVPAALAGVALFFNQAERKAERELASDRLQEAALQQFLDRMTELLLKGSLRTSDPDSDIRAVARARTLTVLPELNGERKANLLRFLFESRLIVKDDPTVPLSAADLSGAKLHWFYLNSVDLSQANLTEADLREAYLSKANLNGARLIGAHLQGAYLHKANLVGANLSRADLTGAGLQEGDLSGTNLSEAKLLLTRLQEANLHRTNLSGADLRKADLTKANLDEANLSRANLAKATITDEQLKQAKSLQDAIMPDGSKHG